MRYYKQISDDYILAIGTGYGGAEIPEQEYNTIMTVILNRPSAEGKGYRLRTDLTWEEYDLPIVDEGEEEATTEDIALALEELL